MLKLGGYNDIPSEIWYKIIQHLSPKDLFECQKVCKLWYLLTRQYYWENIELKTVDNVELFLKSFPKDMNKFVKSVVIGDQHVNDFSGKYTLSKGQAKKLFFNLPNLEKIHITNTFSKKLIVELNNEEFLIEFRKNCPNIRSFKVFEAPIHHHEIDYGNIMYSLRDTATSIIIKNSEHNVYQHIPSFTQMEYLTIDEHVWSLEKFLGFLNKIKTLKRLKYLDFNMNFTFPRNNGHDFQATSLNDIQRTIEEEHAIKERLTSLEKLHLFFDSSSKSSINSTSIITQHFVGLKEIHIIYDLYYDNRLFNYFSIEWINFIFSHNIYKLEIKSTDIHFSIDIVTMYLTTNFKQISTGDKNIKRQLWLILDGSPYDRLNTSDYYNCFEFGTDFSLQFESKEIDKNQYLNLAKIYLMDSENNLNYIYNILNSEKHIMADINMLTFEFTSPMKKVEYPYPYHIFQITDQILSLATDALKKVIIITDRFYKWSKYFVKYEKVKTYRQVTHLEIYVNAENVENVELLDELTLSQCIAVFPCIKYLTLEYSTYTKSVFTCKTSQLFINLPQISLKRLSLDASIFKLMAQEAMKTRKDFLDTCFMLKVETDKKSYYYQISMEFLNASGLTKGDEELDIKNSLQVHIRLKNIECLELYLTSIIYIEKEAIKTNHEVYIYDDDCLIKEKTCEHRIYFE